VWIEQGSQAYLACVIRGTPPASLRENFQDILNRLHAEQAAALAAFDGDAAPFKAVHADLEDCLQAHYESPQPPSGLKLWVLSGAVLLLCLWWGWTSYQAQTRWSHLLAQLRAEPGLVITTARSTWGGYHLEGLRDPLAKDPSLMMTEAGIDPSTVMSQWSPFYALDPRLLVRRAQVMLKPPAATQLLVDGDTLVATGSASVEWAKETRRLAALVPGITHYRDEGLATVSILDLLSRINRTIIHFSPGSATVEPSERSKVNAVAIQLRELGQAVVQSGQRVGLEIRGLADETGSAEINIELSKLRAQTVLAALGGEHPGIFTTVTSGIARSLPKSGAPTQSAAQRIVTFRALMEDSSIEPETARP
jgi:outer membrane protein OmpA-like peptidoglycan-associated protein